MTTYYIWDEENDSLLEEVDENGDVIVTYTNEPGPFGKVISQERNGVTSVYHYDGQGSTVALTDENGNVTDTYIYTAFGELVSSTGTTVNPFRYVGQYGYYTDTETDDIYVRARTYKPPLGRWNSKDPIGFKGSDWNFFEYVNSSPLENVDPKGLRPLCFPPDGNFFKCLRGCETMNTALGRACIANICTGIPPGVAHEACRHGCVASAAAAATICAMNCFNPALPSHSLFHWSGSGLVQNRTAGDPMREDVT